jgi:hypothetical protein
MNNVVGKLLIVLQLVFSLLFMCFAGAVYSFTQSWRTKAETAMTSVAERDRQINELKESHTQELDARKVENEQLSQRATEAEAGLAQVQANIRTLQGELAQTQQQRDKHLADLQVAQAEADARIAETNELRAETKKLRDTVSLQISEIQDQEDKNLVYSGLVAEAKEREVGALKEIGRLQDLLRQNKIDPRKAVVGPVPAEITRVEGKVLGTKQNESRSAELIHVSIGRDDYVTEDMTMDVYRENQYLGRIRITDVYADSAVGILIERTRNGVIERGDNVTTKL